MRNLKATVIVFLLLIGVQTIVFGWGAWAHYRINRSAVFTLPDSMRVFFYNHIDYLTEEAVMPDTRIYAMRDRDEAYRHYIDLELLTEDVSKLPRTYAEALTKYHDSTLRKTGILPWYINELITKLTKSFKEKNKPEILMFCGDIAHYIADAHTPLHTSVNHDGDLTGQKGIHSMWESETPELFSKTYRFNTGNAAYLQDPQQTIFNIVANSHRLSRLVLKADKDLNLSGSAKFQILANGDTVKNRFRQSKHTREYLVKFNAALNNMIQEQLTASVKAVGDIWYTAWRNAGSPDLSSLDDPGLTTRNKTNYKIDYAAWKAGSVSGIRAAPEF